MWHFLIKNELTLEYQILHSSLSFVDDYILNWQGAAEVWCRRIMCPFKGLERPLEMMLHSLSDEKPASN
jgi:hypothetical protein